MKSASRAVHFELAEGLIWNEAAAVPLDLNGPVRCAFDCFKEADTEIRIAALFGRIATRYPNRIAVDDGYVRLTYAETLEAACAVAVAVRAAVPAPADAVVMILKNSVFFHIALLGCLGAGRPVILVDPSWPAQRCRDIMAAARPSAALIDASASYSVAVPPGIPCLNVRNMTRDGNGPSAIRAFDGDDSLSTLTPAVVLYTSGSTGRPKGIVNHERALTQRVAQYTNAGHLHPEDRFVTLSSPCTIAGLREALAALLVGGTLHVADFHQLGIGGTLRRLRAARASILNGVPAAIRMLLRASESSQVLGSLRLVRVGGDVTFWSDIAQMRARLPPEALIQIGFSSTEATGTQWFVPSSVQPRGPRVPVGFILPGNRFALAKGTEEATREHRDREIGQLVLRSRFLSLGHWADGVCSPGPMHADPEEPHARIFATGDVMRLDPDGLLDAVGRVDDQLKINGQRIEPSEVEAVMRASSEVVDAAVLTRRNSDGDPVLVAFFTASQPSAGTALRADLRAKLRNSLPAAMQPARLHLVPEIPSLPSAKPDRAALERLDGVLIMREREMSPVPIPPAPPVEQWEPSSQAQAALAWVWQQILGPQSLAADLPFDEAGGDSLALVSLVHELELSTGNYLPLDLFNLGMRPSDFRSALARAYDARPDNTGVSGCDPHPLVWLLPGIGGDEPVLSVFRAALKDALLIQVVDYPDWRAMARTNYRFADLVEFIALQVEARLDRRGDTVRLAGYSFGGLVATALALRLREGGHSVSCICLLDSAAPNDQGESAGGDSRDNGTTPNDLLPSAARNVLPNLPARRIRRQAIISFAKALHHLGSGPLIELLSRSVRLFCSPRASFLWRAQLNRVMRLDLVRQLSRIETACLSEVPVTLFRSEEHAPTDPLDLGWARFFPRLRVIQVGGSHHSMFDGGNREPLVRQFKDAVAARLVVGAIRDCPKTEATSLGGTA